MLLMILKLYSLLCITFISQVQSQIIRSPGSLLNRPLTEVILESRGYSDTSRPYIENPRPFEVPFLDIPIDNLRMYAPRVLEGSRIIEPLRNYPQPTIITDPCNRIAPVLNVPNIPRSPSTTIVTDCTPSVCKNLADTINLMIVSNLLQNTLGGEEAAVKYAAPILKDLLSNAAMPYPNSVTNFVNPNLSPKMYAPITAGPSIIPPNFITSNVAASSFYDPNLVSPRIVTSSSVPTNNVYGPINSSGLVSNLLRLLGGAV